MFIANNINKYYLNLSIILIQVIMSAYMWQSKCGKSQKMLSNLLL